MTQSGHEQAAFAAMHGPDLLYLIRDPWPWGKPHEATGVHHAYRRCGCGVAARCARAAMARGSTGNAMKGITQWLASIGLSEYAQRFADNAIDLSVLRDLTEQDLKDLGVLLGHRRKILRAIAAFDGVAPASIETATESALRDEAERRHLTVMICDLVGS